MCLPSYLYYSILLTDSSTFSSYSAPLWWIKGNWSLWCTGVFNHIQCLMWFFQTCTSETLNLVTAQRERSVLPDFYFFLFTAMGTTVWLVLLLPLTLCIDREGTIDKLFFIIFCLYFLKRPMMFYWLFLCIRKWWTAWPITSARIYWTLNSVT